MKIIFLTFILLISATSGLYTQENCDTIRIGNPVLLSKVVKNGFIVEKRKDWRGKTSVSYTDSISSKRFNAPTDIEGGPMELMAFKLNSREKVNEIESQIFLPKDLRSLQSEISLAICKISTNGKIIGVQFIFQGGDPNIPINKLAQFARELKEQITFDLTFTKELGRHGYWTLSFPVFYKLDTWDR